METVQFNLPTKIIAGPGAARTLPEMLADDSGLTVAVISDKGILSTEGGSGLVSLLRKAGFGVEIFNEITPNPDEETVAAVTDFLRASGARAVVGLGGGSPMDSAKIGAAMATNDLPLEEYQWNGKGFERPPLPLYLLPTTAGTGSEVTGVSVIASRGTKKGILGRAMYPKAALIDAELMASLPAATTAATGMDALTHGVEAFVGRKANPLSDGFARQAISMAGKNLLRVFENGADLEARHEMALASTMAGIAFDQSGLGIIHAMASPVCADLHVAHGLAMAFLLPYGMEANRRVREGRIAEVGRLIGVADASSPDGEAADRAVEHVRMLQERLGLAEAFRSVVEAFDKQKKEKGIDEADFGKRASEQFLMINNPIHLSGEECADLFTAIFSGYRT